MDMNVIKICVQHLDTFVRKHLPGSIPYVLVLDGHGSRKGVEWLCLCQERNCEVVQSPANTSHFLQPCDQFINKVFQETIRTTRDDLCKEAVTDIKAVGFRLMCAINGFQHITVKHVQESWKVTELWPVDYRFVDKLKRRKDELRDRSSEEQRNLDAAGPSSRIGTVRQRRSDQETFETLANIVYMSRSKRVYGPLRAIQEMTIALKDQDTVNCILMEASRPPSASTGRSDNCPKNCALPCGEPAQYLTHGKVMALRRAQQEAKAREQAEKEQRKELREQKKLVKENEASEKAVKKRTKMAQKVASKRPVTSTPDDVDKENAAPEAVEALLSLAGQA